MIQQWANADNTTLKYDDDLYIVVIAHSSDGVIVAVHWPKKLFSSLLHNFRNCSNYKQSKKIAF